MTAEEQEIVAGIERLARSTAAIPPDASGPEPEHSATPEPEDEQGLLDDPELVSDFVVETREHIASIEMHLLAIERDPSLMDSVHSIFRSFHTIKGIAGFLELEPVKDIAHETETLLDNARERRIPISSRLIDVTLKAADYISLVVEALSSMPPSKALKILPPADQLRAEIALAGRARPVAVKASVPISVREEVQMRHETTEADVANAGEPPQLSITAHSVDPIAPKGDLGVVRVDVNKLEYLVEMVGELVIAQSTNQFAPGQEIASLRNLAHLSKVTGEIQKTALSMRMVPIARLYDRMERLVRDLGRKSGKKIELCRVGDQVELDRNIVADITDPIVHMIRNSIDHGIENADERGARGKAETACITIETIHRSGFIIIRMSDDGRGLDTRRILDKAIQKGMLTRGLPDEQAVQKLIFEPGFSTAERVTQISGRGVGMDVVRRQIEKLHGTVEVSSVAGEGCTFTLKVPLTLAMLDGLLIESCGERYVVPLFSVREIIHVTEDNLFTIEARAEMILLRGSLIPVVRLDRLFGTARQGTGNAEIGIVLEGRWRRYCLIVDRMLGKQEVVVKSLGPCFKAVPGISGGAILGDGRVGLILDVEGIDGGDLRAG